MGLDGELVKLADKSRINRKEFIQNYKGSELDPVWLEEFQNLNQEVGRVLLKILVIKLIK